MSLGRSRPDRSPLVLRIIAALVVVAAIAGGIYIVVKGDDRYPSEWDPKVTEFVAYVEQARGLSFDHPVYVNFLTAEEYTAKTRSAESIDEVDPSVDQETEDYTAIYRALGLVDADFDLSAASDTIADSGTLAFYDPSEKRIYVRGTELTPGLRTTLVHELVHALQDQAFDLERLSDLPSHAASTLRAIAEGDAGRIEDQYREEELSDDERAEAADEEAGDEAAAAELDGLPPTVLALFVYPYVFGPGLVGLAEADGGNDGVDGLFRDIPSEFALFNPIDFEPSANLAADQEVLDPPLPDGAEEIDDATFSPVAWLLILAGHNSAEDALAAAQGIEADGYRSYRLDDRVCVGLEARTIDETAAAALRGALDRWAAGAPASADATVTQDGRTVGLTTCDPGEHAVASTAPIEILGYASLRADLFSMVMTEPGMERDFALCYSEGLADAITMDQVLSGEQLSQTAAQRAAGACMADR